MRFRNVLIVVKDMERSRRFYEELLGFHVIRDFGTNVMMTDGLVLEELDSFRDGSGLQPVFRPDNFELYFEEADLDGFMEKLHSYEPPVRVISDGKDAVGERRTIRIYDPDYHIIEIKQI